MKRSMCDDLLGVMIGCLSDQRSDDITNFRLVSHNFSKLYLRNVNLSTNQFITLFNILAEEEKIGELECLINNKNNICGSNFYNERFLWASYMGYLGVVKLLSSLNNEKKVDPSSDHDFALRFAFLHDHKEAVKFLLSLNDDKNQKYHINPSAHFEFVIQLHYNIGDMICRRYEPDYDFNQHYMLYR